MRRNKRRGYYSPFLQQLLFHRQTTDPAVSGSNNEFHKIKAVSEGHHRGTKFCPEHCAHVIDPLEHLFEEKRALVTQAHSHSHTHARARTCVRLLAYTQYLFLTHSHTHTHTHTHLFEEKGALVLHHRAHAVHRGQRGT